MVVAHQARSLAETLDAYMKPHEEIAKGLEILSTSKNRWDYVEKQGVLWEAVTKYHREGIEAFYDNPEHQFSIAWCLAHVKSKVVKDFFIDEARNTNQYIRWCAMINLRNYTSEDLIDIFIKGLKDRSDLVKGEALKAVKKIRNEKVKKVLLHLISLKSIKNHSPGLYKQAKEILQAYTDI